MQALAGPVPALEQHCWAQVTDAPMAGATPATVEQMLRQHELVQTLGASELKPGRLFIVGDIGGAYYTLMDLLDAQGFNIRSDNLVHLGAAGGCRFNDEVLQFLARRRAVGPLAEAEVSLLKAERAYIGLPTAAAAVNGAGATSGQACAAQAASALTLALQNPAALIDKRFAAANCLNNNVGLSEVVSAASAAVPGAFGNANGITASTHRPLKAENVRRLAACPLLVHLPGYGVALAGGAACAAGIVGSQGGPDALASCGPAHVVYAVPDARACSRAMAMGGSETPQPAATGLAGLSSRCITELTAATVATTATATSAPSPMHSTVGGMHVGLGAIVLPPLEQAGGRIAAALARGVPPSRMELGMAYVAVPLNAMDIVAGSPSTF